MLDADNVGHIGHCSIEGILANDPNWGKSCRNTSAAIMGGGQEDVLFCNIIVITHPNSVREFGRDKYSFPIA
ncbi:hypothetical protein D3C81_1913240 [compost metagenome]